MKCLQDVLAEAAQCGVFVAFWPDVAAKGAFRIRLIRPAKPANIEKEFTLPFNYIDLPLALNMAVAEVYAAYTATLRPEPGLSMGLPFNPNNDADTPRT